MELPNASLYIFTLQISRTRTRRAMGDSEEDNEDAKDMESDGNSDPDIMDDAYEL